MNHLIHHLPPLNFCVSEPSHTQFLHRFVLINHFALHFPSYFHVSERPTTWLIFLFPPYICKRHLTLHCCHKKNSALSNISRDPFLCPVAKEVTRLSINFFAFSSSWWMSFIPHIFFSSVWPFHQCYSVSATCIYTIRSKEHAFSSARTQKAIQLPSAWT